MISWINGTIIQKGDNSLFIASQDLGFEILFGKEFLETCKIGQKGSFFVFSVCREKEFEFYGFTSFKERQLFELLIQVNGLGPKAAQKIISHYNYDLVLIAIKNQDSDFFEKVSGIGKKTAMKIVIDLEKKVAKLKTDQQVIPLDNSLKEDLLSALLNLGYKEKHIYTVLYSLDLQKNKDFNLLFKLCLKNLKN